MNEHGTGIYLSATAPASCNRCSISMTDMEVANNLGSWNMCSDVRRFDIDFVNPAFGHAMCLSQPASFWSLASGEKLGGPGNEANV